MECFQKLHSKILIIFDLPLLFRNHRVQPFQFYRHKIPVFGLSKQLVHFNNYFNLLLNGMVHDPLQSALRKAVTAAFLCPLIRGTHIIVKCVLSSFHHATAHRPHTIRAEHYPAERLDRFLLG